MLMKSRRPFFVQIVFQCEHTAQLRRVCVVLIGCAIVSGTIFWGTMLGSNSLADDGNEKTHCKGEFFKRSNFLVNSESSSAVSNQASQVLATLFNRVIRRNANFKDGCDLRHFAKRDVVKCLDNFRIRRLGDLSRILNKTQEHLFNRPLHIAFFGDSRVRQQFFSFSQLIPLHDIEVSTFDNQLHIDRYMMSRMLNLLLSFSWRPTLLGLNGVNVQRTLKRWLDVERFSEDDAASNSPDFLILGTTLHEMLVGNNGTLEEYSENLEKVKPLLEEVGKLTRVIWYNAYPVIEYNAINGFPEINQIKIYEFNKVTWRVLGDSGIEIWDSKDPLTEEYIRGCAYWKRDDEDMWGFSVAYKCQDSLHTGNAVLQPSTLLLLNELCYE